MGKRDGDRSDPRLGSDADLLEALADGTRVEDAEFQHRNAAVVRDVDAHAGAAAGQP